MMHLLVGWLVGLFANKIILKCDFLRGVGLKIGNNRLDIDIGGDLHSDLYPGILFLLC